MLSNEILPVSNREIIISRVNNRCSFDHLENNSSRINTTFKECWNKTSRESKYELQRYDLILCGVWIARRRSPRRD